MSNIIINDHGASHLSTVIIQLPHNNNNKSLFGEV